MQSKKQLTKTNTMKHTKGNWRWNYLGQNDCYIHEASVKIDRDVPYKGETAIVARVAAKTREKCEANAKLIAAAPDMLNTLKWLSKQKNLGLEKHDRINEAIKKATN